jgi:hypothetical protein
MECMSWRRELSRAKAVRRSANADEPASARSALAHVPLQARDIEFGNLVVQRARCELSPLFADVAQAFHHH